MNVNKVIFEISRTEVPTFTDNLFISPWENGFKVKATAAGNLSVRYVGDAVGTYRILTVKASNTWDLPDLIIEIRDHADTTVDISAVLVGNNMLD